MRVLFMAEDPTSSATDLGGVVGTDPSLTAKIMKVANSADDGLSGPAASATFAVTALGFDTVRAIAAATAAGITGDSGTLPDGFWSHAASCAVACSLAPPGSPSGGRRASASACSTTSARRCCTAAWARSRSRPR